MLVKRVGGTRSRCKAPNGGFLDAPEALAPSLALFCQIHGGYRLLNEALSLKAMLTKSSLRAGLALPRQGFGSGATYAREMVVCPRFALLELHLHEKFLIE